MSALKFKSGDTWAAISSIIINNNNVVQQSGTSVTDVMSQSAVTKSISDTFEAQSAFTTVSVVGASTVNVVADQNNDTIIFTKDDAITLNGNAANDEVTFGLGDIECGDYA